jgi:hypothetical protein
MISHKLGGLAVLKKNLCSIDVWFAKIKLNFIDLKHLKLRGSDLNN